MLEDAGDAEGSRDDDEGGGKRSKRRRLNAE
jgi:hypothetical protein